MAEQAVQTLRFLALFDKPLVATFATPQQSSGSGAIPLKAIGDALGLTARMAACHPEWRQDASPAVFSLLEAEGVEYRVARASTAKPEKRIRRLLGKARIRAKATGETAALALGASPG